jgi:membrane associated rhomboid family serine protease
LTDENGERPPGETTSSTQPPEDGRPLGRPEVAREPIFNIPPMVLALLAVLIAVMGYRLILSEDADTAFVLALALIPARLTGYAAELPGGVTAIYTQFVTHMFVHADAMHLAFNSAALLAFGGALEKRIGGLSLLLFFLVCGLAGAVTFIAFNSGLLAPMIGASGAIAGLMGGVMRYFFSAMDERGGLRRLNVAPKSVPLKSLRAALSDRRLQIVSASFIVMNIAALIGFGDINANNAIAWEAHVGGYLAGLMLFGFFDIAPRHNEVPEYRGD